MKKIILFFTLFLATVVVMAQEKDKGQQGKNKEKNKAEGNRDRHKDKDNGEDEDWKNRGTRSHDEIIWAGTSRENDPHGKPEKNIPNQVLQSFSSQFPNATNTVWTKYRGDRVATFSNAVYTTTVIYHANGQIKEARTVANPSEVPAVVMANMDKYKGGASIGDIVKIERPGAKKIYRFEMRSKGKSQFRFVDDEGNETTYDY